MFQSHRSRLLVAMPPLIDPNFDRSIVLVLEHSPDGALGVVLNRATPERPAQVAGWLDRACDPSAVFSGGPVEPAALIGVGHRPEGDTAHGWEPLGGDPRATIGTVDLALDPADVEVGRLRIFRGYAGWGPLQLDAEIAADAWAIVDAQADDVFTGDPAGLWRRVLARQPNRLAWLAHYPADTSVN